MFVDRLIDSYVTVLSLVHVENILFDAACGLLISPRNEGIIRYYGRERENSNFVRYIHSCDTGRLGVTEIVCGGEELAVG